MLGLATHEPHFSLLREEVRFGRQAQKRQTNHNQDTMTFHLLHLSILREYIEHEFAALKVAASATGALYLAASATGALCPVLCVRPVHGALCATGARCPVPGARCPVPGARCPVHGARCSVCDRCMVPGARCPVPGARCPVPGARCTVPGALCAASAQCDVCDLSPYSLPSHSPLISSASSTIGF